MSEKRKNNKTFRYLFNKFQSTCYLSDVYFVSTIKVTNKNPKYTPGKMMHKIKRDPGSNAPNLIDYINLGC